MATSQSSKVSLIPAVGYVRMSSGRQEKSPAEQRAEITKLRHAGYTAEFMTVEQGVPKYLAWLEQNPG